MIRVPRTQKPPILVKNASKWLAKLQEEKTNLQAAENDLQIIEANQTAKNQETANAKKKVANAKKKVDNALKKYGHDKIKAALVEMFHGKCAYCESKITHVAYGDIEHFRPKSNPLYAHQIFEWENLLLSCPICNNAAHKGTQFPLDLKGNPLLIDPTDDTTDPFLHLEFSWDEDAKLATVYGRDEQGNLVVDIFDLNGVRGREDLLKRRSRKVKRLITLRDMALDANKDDSTKAQAITLLKEDCQPDDEYIASGGDKRPQSLMVRGLCPLTTFVKYQAIRRRKRTR